MVTHSRRVVKCVYTLSGNGTTGMLRLGQRRAVVIAWGVETLGHRKEQDDGRALAVNGAEFADAIDIIRHKGTNRKQFLRGEVDKYTWIDVGSSYAPSAITAACLRRHRPAAEQLQQIVTQADQAPFGLHRLQAPQQEPAKTAGLLDLPEDRLHSLLASLDLPVTCEHLVVR